MARQPEGPKWDRWAKKYRVTIDGIRHWLGTDKAEAWKAFHRLMAARPIAKNGRGKCDVIAPPAQSNPTPQAQAQPAITLVIVVLPAAGTVLADWRKGLSLKRPAQRPRIVPSR